MRKSLVPRGGKEGRLSLAVALSGSAITDGILGEVRAMAVQPFAFDLDKISSLSLLGFN